MSSHVGDGVVESCWRQCYRGDLVVVRGTCQVMLVMVLLSHAGDDAAKATWPERDVDVES
jgi:hypothetical protein